MLCGTDAELLVRGHARLGMVMAFGLGNYTAGGRELDVAEAVLAKSTVPPIARSNALLARGFWLADQDQLDQSLPLFEEAVRLAEAAEGPLSRSAMLARTTMASRLVFGNRAGAAKPHVAAALAAMRALGGPGDVRAALEEARFASWMFPLRAATFAEAASAAEGSLASLRSPAANAPPLVIAEVEQRLGNIYLAWGDVSRAQLLIAKSSPVLLASMQGPRWQWDNRIPLTLAAAWSGRAREAEAEGRLVLALDKTLSMGDDGAFSHYTLAEVLLQDRRYTEAQSVLDKLDAALNTAPADRMLKYRGTVDPDDHAVRLMLALQRQEFGPVAAATKQDRPGDPAYLAELRSLAHAAALCGLGRYDEALSDYDVSLARLSSDRYPASPMVAHWRARMGLCALSAGRKERARELSALAIAALEKQASFSAHFKAPVLELQQRLRRGS
jgi:tetratricopeptide (TPR) repeat protein